MAARSTRIHLALLLLGAALFGQQIQRSHALFTVSTLPTCDTDRTGYIYSVTDADSSIALGSGGGSVMALAQCNGTSWASITTEAAIEALVDLQDLQGAVTDAQVPNSITIDLAATATNALGLTCTDCVALGTETTGGYAASVSEAGPATTATALAANGANCAAGTAPLGVDAAGAVEGCFTPAGAAHNLLSATHSDSLAASVVRGDLLVGNSTPAWSRLAKGTSGTFLKSGVSDPAWSALAAADLPLSATAPATYSAGVIGSTAATNSVAGHVTTSNQSLGAGEKYFGSNVGIGTTAPAASLHTTGTAILGGTDSGLGYADGRIIVTDGNSASASLGQSSLLSIARLQSGGSWPQIATFTLGRWQTNGAAPETRLDVNLKNASGGTDTADTTIMTYQSNGFVGIGTTSPSTRLHVNSSAGTTSLSLTGSGSTGAGGTRLSASSTAAYLYNLENGNLHLGTNSVSRVIIAADGKVAIGPAVLPYNLLDVVSSTAEAAVAITSLGTDTDAALKFELAENSPNFVMGVDDSVSGDPFVLSRGTALGTNNMITANSSGSLVLSQPLGLGTGTNAIVGTVSVRGLDSEGSDTSVRIIGPGAGGGDGYLGFGIDSTTPSYSIGYDNSVSGDPLVISRGKPGNGNALSVGSSATTLLGTDTTVTGTNTTTITNTNGSGPYVQVGGASGDILNVNDLLRIASRTSPPSSSVFGSLDGTIYFDNSGALCVYVSGAWAKLAGSGSCA